MFKSNNVAHYNCNTYFVQQDSALMGHCTAPATLETYIFCVAKIYAAVDC